jgi:hypothetical protein
MRISAAATSLLWLAQCAAIDGFFIAPSTNNGGRYSLHVLPSSKEDDDVVSVDQDETKIDSVADVVKPVRTLQPRPASSSSMSATGYMRAMGTSPRRIVLSFLSASGIALAGNFLGVTSNLLTAIPEKTVEASGLDTYFPRGDFKRCRSKGYTFVIPKEWVADTFIELAKAQRRVQPLDYQIKRREGGGGTLPDSAYGPVGRLNQQGVSESGDTNVSVIVTSGLQGFSLRNTLGPPQTAAEKLLSLSIAPPGSGRVATLLDALEDTARHVYQFEYTVDRGERGPPIRNISVVAGNALGDKLYTLTVVSPLKQWDDPVFASKLRKIATSFHLTT